MKELNIGSRKQTFKLSNGNMVELDVTDCNVLLRLEEALSDIKELEDKIACVKADKTDIKEIGKLLREMHNVMAEKLDYIFDSPVAVPCCGNANLFDIEGGVYRFERIISGLFAAYEDNINTEAKQMQARLDKARQKYGV